MPKVLNIYKDTSNNSVFGGRPGPYGNIFIIGNYYNGKKATRQDVIYLHKKWLFGTEEGLELLSKVKEERGKDWFCYCAPQPCHCDIYLIEANRL